MEQFSCQSRSVGPGDSTLELERAQMSDPSVRRAETQADLIRAAQSGDGATLEEFTRLMHNYLRRTREQSRARGVVSSNATPVPDGALDREAASLNGEEEQNREQICSEMSLTETQFSLLEARAKARFRELAKRRPQRRAVDDPVAGLRDLHPGNAAPYLRALEVFGDPQSAAAWMEQPNPALRGMAPVEAVLTNHGKSEVLKRVFTYA